MPSPFQTHSTRVALPLTALAALALLAACKSAPQQKYQQELFDSGSTPFSHKFNANSADACEAARRALLNQGYLTTVSRPDAVDASKDFQPSGDAHVTVEFHVVCAPGEDADNNTSLIYVNAVQSGYALKKSDTSASVGLSIFGSLSLPIRSNSDAMVKVSSETIQSAAFYDRFFDFVNHYLRTVVKAAPVPAVTITTTTMPAPPLPAPPATAGTSPTPATAPAPAPTPLSSPLSTPLIEAAKTPGASQPAAPSSPVEAPAAPK